MLALRNSYQPGGSSGFSATEDPLSDADACLRDAALMQNLGVRISSLLALSCCPR